MSLEELQQWNFVTFKVITGVGVIDGLLYILCMRVSISGSMSVEFECEWIRILELLQLQASEYVCICVRA